MEINTVTTIALEDKELYALGTLKDAYIQCVTSDCFECVECPLYVDGGCIGTDAEKILAREERDK